MSAKQTQHSAEIEALRSEIESLRASLARFELDSPLRRKENDHWRILLDQSPDFISEIDRDYRIIYTNNLLPQFKMDDVIGKSVLDFIDPAHRAIQKESMDRVFREGVQVSVEIDAVGPNGTRAVYVNAMGPAWRNGELNSLVVVSRNVTELKLREEALRASEERFSKIFHSSPAAMGISRMTDGKLVDANDNMCALMGYPRDEQIGRTVVELNMWVYPEERQKILQRLRNGEAIRNELVSLRTKSGAQLTVMVSMVTLNLHGEEMIVAMLHDITEKHRAEQALRESEERLRMALQSAQLGTWEWNDDRKQNIWDETMHAIYGLAPGSFEGTREAFLKRVHPDDLQRITDASWRMMKPPYLFNEEFRILRGDGAVRWVTSSSKSYCDDAGNVIRMLGVLKDITSRKEAEAQLAESTERLKFALREAKMTAYTWDIAADTLTAVNTLGFLDESRHTRQQDVLAIIHPDDRAMMLHRINSAVNGQTENGEYFSEHRVLLPNGEIRWMLDKGRVSWNAQGRKILNGIVTDITESKRLEEQLLQAQKMESIGRLAGGIAHDFNNLLTVVMVSVESLAGAANASGPSAQRHLQNIRDSANRAASLTTQLLAFARKQMIHPRIVDLNEVARKMEALLCRLIGENIRLVSDYDNSLGRVRVDPTQIEQLIMNLAVNARDAMPAGGALELRTRNVDVTAAEAETHEGATAGPHIELAIADTGAGMSDDTMKHLFEPFFTTKEVGRGTGLGLATCYGVVRQNGGHIRVQSSLGKGTVFSIYLPRAEGLVAAPATPLPDAPPTGNETVLLVEDEPQLRTINAVHLRQLGYTVLEAEDGEQALRVARVAGPIHLLLSDVIMPRMGGEELARILTQERPTLRVLYVSGYAANIARLTPDASAYLQKPFTLTALALRIREILDAKAPR